MKKTKLFATLATAGCAVLALSSCGAKEVTSTEETTVVPTEETTTTTAVPTSTVEWDPTPVWVNSPEPLFVDEGTPEKEGYHVYFSDEFNGEELNETYWTREVRAKGWVNSEWQSYTNDTANSFLRDGKLVIKGIGDEEGNYTSAKITSVGDKMDFTYGRVEVVAKTVCAQGLLPAIWMMPPNESSYGGWPRCGEIDMMETLGADQRTVYGTIHYGLPHEQNQGTVKASSNLDEDFHEYAIEWEPGKITWYLDGVKFHQATDWYSATFTGNTKPFPAPFNHPFAIQMNLAIGGNWPGAPADHEGVVEWEFEIDSVRVYQKDSYNVNVQPTTPNLTGRDPDATGNYITNSNFSKAEDLTEAVDWQFVSTKGGVGTATIADNMITIVTEDKGTEDYSIQLIHNDMLFEKGKSYKVSFEIWADEERTIKEIGITAPNHDWKRYWKTTNFTVTTTKTKYEYEFNMINASDDKARFEFNMGNCASTATIHITNVRVEEA